MEEQDQLTGPLKSMPEAAPDTPLSIIDFYDSNQEQKPPSRQQSFSKPDVEDARPDSATIGPPCPEKRTEIADTIPATLSIPIPQAKEEDQVDSPLSDRRSMRSSFNDSIIERHSPLSASPKYVACQGSQPGSAASGPGTVETHADGPEADRPASASSIYSPEQADNIEGHDQRRSIRRSFNGSIITHNPPASRTSGYVAYRGHDSAGSGDRDREDASESNCSPSGPPGSLWSCNAGRLLTAYQGAGSNPFSDNAPLTGSIGTRSQISTPPSSINETDCLPLGENRLRYGMKRLWDTSTYTDIAIICRDYVFPVHRCVLSTQCAYFKKACTDPFPSRNGLALDMSFEDPDALRCMLGYFYTSELDVPTEDYFILGGPAIPSLGILRKVYRLGMKYNLPDMKALALEQYCTVAATARPRGNALLLAKALTELFAEDSEDLEELRKATIETVILHSQEVLTDAVACDQMQGEPLRALALEMSRLLNKGNGEAGLGLCTPSKHSEPSEIGSSSRCHR